MRMQRCRSASEITAKLISDFIFSTGIVQFLYFLNPKFPVSSHLLCLYSLVSVGPVRKPHCWFSLLAAQLCFQTKLRGIITYQNLTNEDIKILAESKKKYEKYQNNMSRLVGKPTICIGENKGADQLRGNREADQRLCFRYSDSTIPLLLNSKISSF